MGITVGAVPVILPVNYVLEDGMIRFRTVKGSKLASGTTDTVIAFEADDYDSETGNGWSVLVQGFASEVTDEDVCDRVFAAIPDPVGVAGARCVVEINIELISGRRFDDC